MPEEHRKQRLRGSKLAPPAWVPSSLQQIAPQLLQIASQLPHSAQRCREAYSKVVARRSCAAPRQEMQTFATQSKIRPVGLAAELITASCDNNHRLITLTSDPTANRTAPCYLSGNAGGALYPNMDAAPSVGRGKRMRGIQRGRNHYAVGFLPL